LAKKEKICLKREFPLDVFTHCFVLRTKGVLGSFSFGFRQFFKQKFFSKFLFEKLPKTMKSLFSTPFSEAKTVSKYIWNYTLPNNIKDL
jgi:hypothetical protein